MNIFINIQHSNHFWQIYPFVIKISLGSDYKDFLHIMKHNIYDAILQTLFPAKTSNVDLLVLITADINFLKMVKLATIQLCLRMYVVIRFFPQTCTFCTQLCLFLRKRIDLKLVVQTLYPCSIKHYFKSQQPNKCRTQLLCSFILNDLLVNVYQVDFSHTASVL